MRRRLYAVLIATLAVIWPMVAASQSPTKIPRLCFLEFDRAASEMYQAFFEALHRLGYIDGRTIIIDRQFANGRGERFPELARECVRRNSDVIVVRTTPAAQAAKNATRTIPIVMINLGDPVGTGLVDSLARPGGNVTGTSFMAPVLAVKRLELLREAVPRLTRILMLSYPADPIDSGQVKQVKRAAQVLGVTIDVRQIRSAADFPAAFDGAVAAGCEGILVSSVSFFFSNRAEVLERIGQQKWPGVFPWRQYVEGGGLMFYSHRPAMLFDRAAVLVDKILKGAEPGNLPIEQPTEFELVVNLKAARVVGIAVPQSILALADEVVE